MQAFDWAYSKAVDGLPGFAGAEQLATEHAAKHASLDEAVKAVIAVHTRLAGATGFATGCGGFIALPVALPANLAGALYLQTRLVAAIAHLHGHDIRSPRVRMLVLACLSGSKAADTLRDAGIRVGTRLGATRSAGPCRCCSTNRGMRATLPAWRWPARAASPGSAGSCRCSAALSPAVSMPRSRI
jgi:hypothetical protein